MIDTDHQRNILHRIEENNRIPVVVYDTDWKDEKVQPITSELQSSIQNAQQKYPANIEYEQAKINSPKPILSRERYERLENNNQEVTQHLTNSPVRQDHSIERTEDDTNLISNSGQTQQILCHSIDQHVQMNDEEMSSIADDSLLIRHQQHSNININETTPLENPLRSTAFLTLIYPQHNEEANPQWQRSFDQQFYNQSHSQEQQLQVKTEEISPRYLPSISTSDNYVSEFQQTPLLHENVRIQNFERIPLLPSTQINQTRPIYRVRQQQISANDDYDYSTIASIHPEHIDRINTSQPDSQLIGTIHVEPPPVTIDIEIRARPTYSETSSLQDMESVLNRFEENLEPEQHLPLVDQISLSYTTSIRSTLDDTHRAIERYEQEHPFFSRSLPREWLQPAILPNDEQLVEQWTVEKSLDTIQQQVELNTNHECESVVVITTAAIATDAYFVGERFEEEESTSSNPKNIDNEEYNIQFAAPVIVSHCSPTSDYETDSLDKDNDTASTTTSLDGGFLVTTGPIAITAPAQSFETTSSVPMNYFLETLSNELKTKQDIYRAKENQLEDDEDLVLFNFDEHQQELLNIFFEPTNFHLPLINEISIYQLSFHQEYSMEKPSNLLQAITHTDDPISSNEYQTNQQEIFSIAHVNNQSDHEEDLESISQKYDPPSHIKDYHTHSSDSLTEPFSVHINEPPQIIENEDEQSILSILPDVIPSSSSSSLTSIMIQNEVKRMAIQTENSGISLCMFINLLVVNPPISR